MAMDPEAARYLAVRGLYGAVRSIESNRAIGLTDSQIAKYLYPAMGRLGEFVTNREELVALLNEYSQGDFTPDWLMTTLMAYLGYGIGQG